MQHYRQEQVNRRAAIKLMFTTSLTGVMTSELDYDPGRPRSRVKEDENDISLNLPQVRRRVVGVKTISVSGGSPCFTEYMVCSLACAGADIGCLANLMATDFHHRMRHNLS